MYCWHFAWFGIATISLLAVSEICVTVLKGDRISMYSYRFYGWKLFFLPYFTYVLYVRFFTSRKSLVQNYFWWLWMKLLIQSNRSDTFSASPKYRRHHFTGGNNKGSLKTDVSLSHPILEPHPNNHSEAYINY